MNELALCAGIGGLSLGVKRAVPTLRTVCYVERELYAAAVLARQMQTQQLDSAPIWTDLRTLDCDLLRGQVDLVTAGFPCQPHSFAGKREGTADARWIFDDIARIVREVGARIVFLENVPGLASSGLDRVLGALADLGFDAEWGVFSAAEAGAPHLRKRMFILAADANGNALRTECRRGSTRTDQAGPRLDGAAREVADTDGRRPERDPEHDRDPVGRELGDRDDVVRCHPPWEAEPRVGRVADGVSCRVDRLRALGNSAVPATVELAWRTLSGRFLAAAALEEMCE